jgi:hypothetical protein
MALPKHLWETTDHALNDLQVFIDSEIAKKQEKERLKNDRENTRKLRIRMTVEEELAEDTKVHEADDEYLIFYFKREKQILEGLYGKEWINFVKHPEYPRCDYEIHDSRKSSTSTSTISTSRRMSILGQMAGKSRIISPFYK